MQTIRARAHNVLCAFVCVVVWWSCLAGPAAAAEPDAPQSVIIVFADGVAPTQWEFGRMSSQVLRGRPYAVTDTVFRQGGFGLLKTYSADAMVTDSAASATAMSIGHKTNNYMVGVKPDGSAGRTVMQAARAAGKRIGLVTTAAVYDASPAAFSVQALNRRDSQKIVDEYVKLEPDVLLGGGAAFFLPERQGGRRTDGRNVLEDLGSRGYAVARTTAELAAAQSRRLVGLFAPGDMAFEIDRDPATQPTTAEMMAAALRTLSRDSPSGFVLFVENENTDTAGHQNDAAALMHALWAVDDALRVALDFQKQNPRTLIIVTGDHEAGGLAVTHPPRSPLPGKTPAVPGQPELDRISRITMSFDQLIRRSGRTPAAEVLDPLLAKHFPGFTLDADLRDELVNPRPSASSYGPHGIYAKMVARQTGIHWGTSGHTTEPVAVGAIGPGAERFRGYLDNTDFARILHDLIGTGR